MKFTLNIQIYYITKPRIIFIGLKIDGFSIRKVNIDSTTISEQTHVI